MKMQALYCIVSINVYSASHYAYQLKGNKADDRRDKEKVDTDRPISLTESDTKEMRNKG